MFKKASIIKRMKVLRLLFGQILLVILTFALMVFASYSFSNNVWFLAALGLILAAVLSAGLILIHIARTKLEEKTFSIIQEKNALINLGNILDGLNALICVMDPETDELLFINQKMKDIFSIKENWKGKKCYKTFRKIEQRCDFCPYARLNSTPPDKDVIWERKELNGTYRAYSRYIRWLDGKKVHLQYAVDITDLRKTQDELVNQNIRLNLLIKGLNVALWDYLVNPEAEDLLSGENEIWWSSEFRQILGFTDGNDFPNKIGAWFNQVHPDYLENAINDVKKHFNDPTGKTPYDSVYLIKVKSGQYRWFRAFGTTLRDSENRPLRTVGAIEDITERKEAEREIAEKTELNQIMFNSAPVGLTMFDKNFRFVDCNENVLKIYGITREYYKDFFGSKAHSPEYQRDGSNSMEKAMNIINRLMNGENMKVEWIHLTPDGEPLPVELAMTRIKQGDKYLGLGYIYDMREQYKLKDEIEIALHKAESANRAKSAFLANMSHEIRTPMNAILGITEIQLRNENLSPEMEEGLEKVYESGNLLLNIINDILDLSKVEAGKLEIVQVKYAIPSLINDTVQMNRLHYGSKPIELHIDVDINTPLNLYGDELRLKQILINILSNAYKYTDKGEIKMSVCFERSNNMTEDDVILIFRISDTGQGMTEEQVEMLFNEYTRFNLEINRTTAGTGLGMTITKHLVDLMGGELIVESVINKGSVFTIRVPQKRVDDLVCGSELALKMKDIRFQSSAMLKKNRVLREYMPYGSVLVVDDVESNIYVTSGMLLPYGLKIDTAKSGFEAINKIKTGSNYDVIFMDHMMPKMDGIEAAKIIRSMGFKKYIIALTANALVGQAEKFMNNGFDGFISKPIDSRELNQLLNEFIRNKKSCEVVKTARLEQQESLYKENKIQKHELGKFFLLDAENAVSVLENICSKLNNTGDINDDVFDTYEITVHGMKSALANIDEEELSSFAFKLEQASLDKNITFMLEKTQEFVDALKMWIERYKLTDKENNNNAGIPQIGDISEEDMVYLKETLLSIKTACETLNKNEAKAALNNLMQKSWPEQITGILDEIDLHLLHSASKKVTATIEKNANIYNN